MNQRHGAYQPILFHFKAALRVEKDLEMRWEEAIYHPASTVSDGAMNCGVTLGDELVTEADCYLPSSIC